MKFGIKLGYCHAYSAFCYIPSFWNRDYNLLTATWCLQWHYFFLNTTRDAWWQVLQQNYQPSRSNILIKPSSISSQYETKPIKCITRFSNTNLDTKRFLYNLIITIGIRTGFLLTSSWVVEILKRYKMSANILRHWPLNIICFDRQMYLKKV